MDREPPACRNWQGGAGSAQLPQAGLGIGQKPTNTQWAVGAGETELGGSRWVGGWMSEVRRKESRGMDMVGETG